MYCKTSTETDCLAPCRHQLYWRKAEQQKINSNKQNYLFAPTPNYKPGAFCILCVQEHNVNSTVLQQEAKDKTWWTISFLSTNLSLCFCLCFTKYRLALQMILATFSFFFFFFWLFHKLFKVLQMHLFFQNSCLNFSKRHVPKCYTICGLRCMVTMQNFWPLSGWQREIIPKMKTDVLVIIISHFRLYF